MQDYLQLRRGNKFFNNLVGEPHELPLPLASCGDCCEHDAACCCCCCCCCDNNDRLKMNFANESNFALTNGDLSECSPSEFVSCSELIDLPLKKHVLTWFVHVVDVQYVREFSAMIFRWFKMGFSFVTKLQQRAKLNIRFLGTVPCVNTNDVNLFILSSSCVFFCCSLWFL